ncbi:unnamed protein product, partial [Brassica napus]
MLMLRDDQTPKVGASLSQSKRMKILIVGIKPNIPDLNVKPCYDSDEKEKGEFTNIFQNFAGLKSHDGCYVHHKLLYELEVEIFAQCTNLFLVRKIIIFYVNPNCIIY